MKKILMASACLLTLSTAGAMAQATPSTGKSADPMTNDMKGDGMKSGQGMNRSNTQGTQGSTQGMSREDRMQNPSTATGGASSQTTPNSGANSPGGMK